jgi:DNA-binding transcriptional MerR regulator
MEGLSAEKLYYSIGEVAGMFGVNISTIRFYAGEFNAIKPHKNKKGNRLFTRTDIDHFTRIFSLTRDQGFSLADAKEIMDKKEKPIAAEPEADIATRLKKVKGMLSRLLNELEKDQ